ncbi:glutamate racemase [Uliginosibacterium gangwonense]|uniref:glutamate racemase n=1 Tax=Uliginosibacterium gangwonense TaxID=392736 RepID=UPI00039F3246|nr:glutamate racemase [Uliginosibacterium gangwonense]
MADVRPIGVFDSGLGGVSVLHELRRQLPNEDFLYCADSGYAPYGEKPQSLICERSLEICEFLLAQQAKALVIACNTATAAAAQAIRQRWPSVPVIAMEPAVKPATAATLSGVVGVLATTGTIESARFAALLDTFGQGVEVVTRPGTGLVEHVERGDFDSPALHRLLVEHLGVLTQAGADVVVLGCTHYVFLRPLIEALLGPKVKVIDTGLAVARHLQHRLEELGGLSPATHAGPVRFWNTGRQDAVMAALAKMWPEPVVPQALPESVCMQAAQVICKK